jgi:UDP-N-acetylglucosamine--N-acetylmuramyl-(pentapeptide) pyrophosphoryl-undecaprenol N-acetylglucosamine transferase
MRILVAGGGTGGHVYPALAVIEALRHSGRALRVGYAGTRTGMERRIVGHVRSVPYFAVPARGMRRGRPFSVLLAAIVLALGLARMLLVFVRFRPRVVLGMGGYASAAAVILGIVVGKVLPVRTVIHEQNARPGMTNRVLGRFVDAVLVSFPETRSHFRDARRVVVTGNPVRAALLTAERSRDAYRRFGLDETKRTVLVFGGSRGSQMLISAAVRAASAWRDEGGLQVLLITGGRVNADRLQRGLARVGIDNVAAVDYVERMEDAFAVADLVVSRAGATTVAEIAVCGKPAVLVPWRGAAEDHQMANATLLRAARACEIADETQLHSGGLVPLVEQVIGDELRLRSMSARARSLGVRNAAFRVLGEVAALAGEATS